LHPKGLFIRIPTMSTSPRTIAVAVFLGGAVLARCRSSVAPREKSVAVQTRQFQEAMTPSQALETLRACNARFDAARPTPRDLPAQLRATASAQYPFALIVSCLDSWQPVELILDQGIGDVFNARVAGNVLNDDILGNLEFACKALV
jgi:carbonic anhydrase